MRFVIKWLLIVLVVAVVVGSLLVGYVYWRSAALMAKTYSLAVPDLTIPSDDMSIARGKHLVEKVSLCIECHDKDLGGKMVSDDFPFGRLAATNLTRGRGGIGNTYKDSDYVRVMTHGVKRNGHSVLFMPSADYKFTAADMAAIIAYIRSVPPVDREHPEPSIGPLARALAIAGKFPLFVAEMIDHDQVAFVQPANLANPVSAGDYLISTAGCRGCHRPDFTGGAGPPPGASNLTPVGIGGWTEPDFIRAIREHKRPNGSAIAEEMPRIYGTMSDDDLRKIFAFLQTVPPKGQKTKNQMKG